MFSGFIILTYRFPRHKLAVMTAILGLPPLFERGSELEGPIRVLVTLPSLYLFVGTVNMLLGGCGEYCARTLRQRLGSLPEHMNV